MKYWLRDGTLCYEDRLQAGDLLIEDEKIVACGDCRGMTDGAETVAANGAYVLPGLIDLHVHLDECIGGYELADGWRSGSLAAVKNGITTLCGFVTQAQGETLGRAIARASARASGNCHADYLWHLTPTRFAEEDWNEVRQLAQSGWRTFKFYTTYRESGLFRSYEQLEQIITQLKPWDVRFLVHAEDEEVLHRAQADEADADSAVAHARQRPPEAEFLAVKEILRIAAATSARMHVVHVSTAAAAAAIAGARAAVAVTCETAPHYLFLDESWLLREDGHRWLCTPPLRERQDMQELRGMARTGMIDAIATDHCAFTRSDKDRDRGDIRAVPKGIAGIGALAHLVYRLNGDDPARACLEMSSRLAKNPAVIAGIYPRKGTLQPGADADVLVLETGGRERPLVSSLADCHETYPGFTTCLHVRRLFLRGRPLVRDDEPAACTEPAGKCLRTI